MLWIWLEMNGELEGQLFYAKKLAGVEQKE